MRILLTFIILIEIGFAAFGETSVKVRRGDTWRSIASKYDIDPDELKLANGNIAECYLGMDVIIPDYLIEKARFQREIQLESERQKELENLYERAERLENNGNLKEAKKIYDKILEIDQSAWAYYSRGWIQYNRKKWGDAISDFSRVTGLPDATQEMKESAITLSQNAKENQEIAAARRAELVGNIFGMAVATAGVITGAIMANKASKPSASSSGRVSRPQKEQYASNANKLSFQEQYDKYMSPEAFLYNYTHGLPTLPSASEMGLSGSDAYAYEVQRSLQERSINMDRQVMNETYKLIEEGSKLAKKEIEEFEAKYGRPPTDEEISQIYKKYTQGYLDAYADYVGEKKTVSDELGLTDINRTKSKSAGNKGNSTDKKEKAAKSKTETNNKTTNQKEKENKVKKNEKGNEEDPNYGRYIQRMVNVYDYNTETVLFEGAKVYLKGPTYYLHMKGGYYKVSKSNKAKFGYKIMVGSKEYFFNM